MLSLDAPQGAQQLYTRHAHGNLPVKLRVEGDTEFFDLGDQTFTSKGLLEKLYGRPVVISWRRYFKVAPPEPSITGFIARLPRKAVRCSPGHMAVGIDLDNRFDEVRKLVYKGFRARILASGFDLEDVLQEIYLGLVVRNRGTCPWDARTSSFGHYIHMVANCLLANYRRKEVRRPEREAESLGSDYELGSYDLDHGEFGEKLALASLERFLGEGASKKVLQPLLEGKSKREIASALNLPETTITKAIAELRASTADWKNLDRTR